MEAKSSNLSVLLEEGVKRGRVKMDFETEIRFGSDVQKIIIISISRRAICEFLKGWLAIAKLKPLSLFISLLLMLKKAFDNVKIGK